MKVIRPICLVIAGILILGIIGQSPIVKAQDLSFSDNVSKKSQKMDSSLAKFYELKSQGKVLPFSTHISTNGENVRVVIDLIDVGVEIPQNLGIEVETSYENMIQAMVPIQNLQKIASDKNVKFIRLPSEIETTIEPTESEIEPTIEPTESEIEPTIEPTESEIETTIEPTESEAVFDNFNFIYLAIILVIVLPIIYYKIKKGKN